MNTYTVFIEYAVVRQVEIITEQDMTDAEIEAEARKADTEFRDHMPAVTIHLRRILQASQSKVANIVRDSDDFTIENGQAVVKKLIANKCFAPDGRLGNYPDWLSMTVIDRLVVLGLFRRESGTLENYMDAQYYLLVEPT